jgi:hypothetical protein
MTPDSRPALSLRHASTVRLMQTFIDNLGAAAELEQLPLALATETAMHQMKHERLQDALRDPLANLASVREVMQRLPSGRDAEKRSAERLQYMEARSWGRWFSLMRRANAVLMWTAIECLAKDGWATAVNDGPLSLAMRAAGKARDDTSTEAAKTISIAVLKDFDFNIKGRLGDVLKNKFRFSDPGRIEAAYRAAFDGQSSWTAAPSGTTIADALAQPALKQLAATRHAIAHRAGVVDDAFKRASNLPCNIGEEVPLSDGILASFAAAAHTAGRAICGLIDATLADA